MIIVGSLKTTYDWIALILLIVGAINWGVVGLANIDLVAALLGTVPLIQTSLYVLVGLAGLYGVYFVTRDD